MWLICQLDSSLCIPTRPRLRGMTSGSIGTKSPSNSVAQVFVRGQFAAKFSKTKNIIEPSTFLEPLMARRAIWKTTTLQVMTRPAWRVWYYS